MPPVQGLRAEFIYPYARAADKDEAGSHHWTVGRISGRAFARYESITRPVGGKHDYWHEYRHHQSHTSSDTADGHELAVFCILMSNLSSQLLANEAVPLAADNTDSRPAGIHFSPRVISLW
jgi:hypothetical protein